MRKALLLACVVMTALAGMARAEDVGWPVEFKIKKGLVTVYQPQVDSLKDETLECRAAFSFTPTGKTEPLFGALWITATLRTDRDTRMATLAAVKIPKIKFADATDEEKKKLGDYLEQEFMKLPFSISIDRLIAQLDTAEKDSRGASQFKNDPPKILIAYEPAVLVTFDGDPIVRDINDTMGKYRKVVNTPFPIVYDVKRDSYFLCGGSVWYVAKDPLGPWSLTTSVPVDIELMKPKDDTASANAAATGSAGEGKDVTPPEIVTAKGAAELLVFVGQPTWKPIEGTALLYADNTDSDVFKSTDDQRTFVLLSGRWFASTSLDGPWQFVPPRQLPETFKKIPEESPNGHVLGSVPGTELAKEALLDAQIPQTAAVKRSGVTLQVEYDGAPQFKAIEGTKLEYAVNTSFSVIKTGERYYCCHQAVWYVAASPQGPWQVADSVPDDIYTIPPSNPNYNTTEVKVYASTPEVVYTGYYPGYMGGYVYGGCVVYGTGWYYPPYISPYVYYPFYPTWGLHVGWNPYYGWGFGVAWSSGPFTISIGFGGWGGYGGWWGAGGYHPPYYRPYPGGGYTKPGYGPGGIGQGNRNQINPNSNLYARGENQARNASAPRAKDTGRAAGAAAAGRPATGKADDVFADRNGDVYRRNGDGSWDKRSQGSWSGAGAGAGTRDYNKPSASSGSWSGAAAPAGGGTRSGATGAAGGGWSGATGAGPSSLDRDYSSRQRGDYRASSYSGMRAGGGFSGGGGGGRRR